MNLHFFKTVPSVAFNFSVYSPSRFEFSTAIAKSTSHMLDFNRCETARIKLNLQFIARLFRGGKRA